MRYAAIIVAAGRGTRAGGPLPKQWQEIAGKPVARWTLERFAGADTRVLVIHPDDRDRAEAATDGLDVRLVPGGQSRGDSVQAGLEALVDLAPECVLIHDAARPCVTDTVIADTLAALKTSPGAAPALAVTDALWTGAEDRVTGTHAREGLYRAQTPQGFHYAAILAAHRAHDGPAPDDVEIARAAGLAVAIVPGSEDNLKITGPGDLARAAAILERRYGYPAG